MNKKRVIYLYDLEQLAIIISHKSDVIYTNQTGGYACMQPQEEGVLAILEDTGSEMTRLLAEYTLNKTRLTEDDADYIDSILREENGTRFLMVNRKRLEESMEAWIHVRICAQKPNTGKNELLDVPKEKISEMEHSFVYNLPFCGFENSDGVLTWENSD